jgi:hypothetical protein
MVPNRIVILRHAEKPEDPRDPDLRPAGEERAAMLATLIPAKFGGPDFLMAATPSKHSNRPYDTSLPLSQKLNMEINHRYADDGYEELASDLLAKPKYGGKLIIICWHHGHIPDLGLALGVTAEQLIASPGMLGLHWDPAVFDRFWVLDFPRGPPRSVCVCASDLALLRFHAVDS